jgi:GNAT superfamily N-acetyltransferase
VQVRPAVPADLPRLVPLVRHYWAFEGIAGFDPARTAELLGRLLHEPALGEIWIAADASGLTGYLVAVCMLSLEHQGLMAEIDELFVLPQARRSGAGAGLLQAAEASLAARGCVRLQLQLAAGNAAARHFYGRHGYAARGGYQLLDKALA